MVTEYTYDNLVIENPVTDNRLKLANGNTVERGALLKLDTGKLVPVTDAADTPHSIAVDDADATSGDADIAYYVAGVFNENEINYGGATADDMREALRNVGIITKKGV